jgi:hypothetical protein
MEVIQHWIQVTGILITIKMVSQVKYNTRTLKYEETVAELSCIIIGKNSRHVAWCNKQQTLLYKDQYNKNKILDSSNVQCIDINT